MAKLPLFHFHC